MSESLPRSPELPPGTALLPMGQALDAAYEERIIAQGLPSAARLAQPGEVPHVTTPYMDERAAAAYDPQADIGDFQAQYLHNRVLQAGIDTWWYLLPAALAMNGASSEAAANVPVIAKHTAALQNEAQPSGQSFEIYEIGEPANPEDLETVVQALQTIDKYSGGLLSGDPNRPPILLATGFALEEPSQDGDVVVTGGIASHDFVILNATGIRSLAARHGADHREVLAASTAHELLGHNLEYLMGDRGGQRFREHFDYSNLKEIDPRYGLVHANITAKDPSHADSRPVNAYGKKNAAEDQSTSIEAAVSMAEDWNQAVATSSTSDIPDVYRSEIALAYMNEAAQKAKEQGLVPGIVGSAVQYAIDPQTGALGVRPAGEFVVTSMSGEEAIRMELQDVVNKFQPPQEIIVRVES